MTALVVGWDCDVNELGWGVSVAERDHGDVDVRGLLDGLGIGAWVGDNDETWFLERAGDIVGEVSWCKPTCDCDCTGVGCELEDGTLTIGTGGDDTDVGWVVNGGDDACCEDDLLPGAEAVS